VKWAWVALLSLILLTPAEGAEITGRLMNGSQPNGVIAGTEVRLTARLSTNERLERSAVTNDEGWFRFTELPGDTADVYVLSARFGGVEYASQLIAFVLGETEIETDLLMYEQTADPADLDQHGHHYILEIPGGAHEVAVTEVIALANHGQRTFHDHQGLAFPIPPLATNVEPMEGFETGAVHDGAIHLSVPLRPGNHQVAFRYNMPASSPFRFTGHVAMPTEEITILVAPVGADVSGEGLAPMGQLDLGNGVVCDRYRVAVPAVGSAFTVRVGVQATGPRLAWVFTGALLLSFVAIIYLRERPAGSSDPMATRDAKRLLEERDRHLAELLVLDRQQKNGGLPDDEYGRRREQLLAKATALQEIADQSAGSRA